MLSVRVLAAEQFGFPAGAPGREYFFPEPLGTKMLNLPKLPKIA